MLDLFEHIPDYFANKGQEFSFLVRMVRDNVVSSGRLQRIANARDDNEMFVALDMLKKNEDTIFKSGLQAYKDKTHTSVSESRMALRRIAATKLIWEELQKLSVDVNPEKRKDALKKMEKLLKVGTDPVRAATVFHELKDLLIPHGIDELDRLFPVGTVATITPVDLDQLAACANGLAKAAQKTYVQAYFDQYIVGEDLEISDAQAAAIADFVAEDRGEHERRTTLVNALNTLTPAPADPFKDAMLDQLEYKTRPWTQEVRHITLPKKRELGVLRQQAAHALITSKIKQIAKWLLEHSAPTDPDDQKQKARYEKVLIDIAQAGQDQKAIVQALHLNRGDLGNIPFEGHYKDEVLLNKDQKLALGALATQKLGVLSIPLDIVMQHKKLLGVMTEFRSVSMLDAKDYKAASGLKSWHDKKQQPAVPVQEASLGKELKKEQGLLDSDLNAACKYVNEVSKGLETIDQAAKQKASKAAQAGVISDDPKLRDFLPKLEKAKQAFTQTVTALNNIRNANGTRQEIIDQLDRCRQAYQVFSKEIQWANKVADHFNEVEGKFKTRFPNNPGLFQSIQDKLKKLYEKPQVTALGSQLVFDRLCKGPTEEDPDPVTLSERLDALQKESDLYDEILVALTTAFKKHPEQHAQVLKELEANWGGMVRHNKAGRQALDGVLNKLYTVAGAVGDKDEAKTLSAELIAPITQFVFKVEAEERKKQRRGVRDLNADPKNAISTAQFHGFKEDEFEDVLKAKVKGETIQEALRLKEDIGYFRYKSPDAGGPLMPLDPQANANDESIVKVEFYKDPSKPLDPKNFLDVTVYCQDAEGYKKGDIVVTPGPGMILGIMLANPPVDLSKLDSTGDQHDVTFKGHALTDKNAQPAKLCLQQMAYVYAIMFDKRVTCSLDHEEREDLIAIAESGKKLLTLNLTLGAPASSSPAPGASPRI